MSLVIGYCYLLESFSLLCTIKAVLQSSSTIHFILGIEKPSQKYAFPKSHLHENHGKFLSLSVTSLGFWIEVKFLTLP